MATPSLPLGSNMPDPTSALGPGQTSNPNAGLPLRDLHLPDPVGIWPLAPGWWLLIAIGIALLVWLSWSGWKLWKSRRPLKFKKKAAQELLKQLETEWLSFNQDEQALALPNTVSQINALLKRLIATDYSQALHLHGSRWTDFLTAQNTHVEFSETDRQRLAEAGYQPVSLTREAELSGLFQSAAKWIQSYQPVAQSSEFEHSKSDNQETTA